MALCRKSGKIKILHSKLLQQVMYKCWNAIYNIYHQLYFSGRVYACRIYWNVVLPILSTFAVTILMGDLWSSPLLGSWLWVYEIQTEKVKKYSCTVFNSNSGTSIYKIHLYLKDCIPDIESRSSNKRPNRTWLWKFTYFSLSSVSVPKGMRAHRKLSLIFRIGNSSWLVGNGMFVTWASLCPLKNNDNLS